MSTERAGARRVHETHDRYRGGDRRGGRGSWRFVRKESMKSNCKNGAMSVMPALVTLYITAEVIPCWICNVWRTVIAFAMSYIRD